MAKKPHRLARIAQSASDHVWAILPEKLEQICAFLDQRANGEFLSEDEIQAAIGDRNDEEAGTQTVEGIRILTMRGTVMPRSTMLSRFSGGVSCELVTRQIEKAVADSSVKSILIRGDSPGGSVFGVAELATAIYEARGKKPIYFWTDSGQCCSAMYWIASACTKVFASEGSEIGSIGVIAIHYELTKAAEDAGYKFTVLRSVENKAVGQPYEVLDQKKQAVLMDKIQTWHGAFVEAVGRNRGLDASTINEKFGAGKTFRADQAADLGLIDGVRTFPQVFESLRSSGGEGVSTTIAKEIRMHEMIKAALVAEGLIPSMSTDDAVAEQTLKTFFTIKGIEQPEKPEAIAKAIRLHSGPLDAVSTQKPPEDDGTSTTAPAAPNAAEIQKAERDRVLNLGATGRMMGVDSKAITEAVEAGLTVEEATTKWVKLLSDSQPPVDPYSVSPTGDSFDAFIAAASDGILEQLGAFGDDEKPAESAREFRGMEMIDIAKTGLRLANQRIGSGESKVDICERFLKLAGTESMPLAASDGAGPTYGPGHYPDLMSNVANRLINRGQKLAPATFPEWTATLSDVSDFRPRTIINTGAFGLFSHILDGKGVEEGEFGTEANFIAVERFGKGISLTPIMMANDDLDAWSQAIMQLGIVGDLTINAQCISHLFSTSPLPDGDPLFHANHANIVSGGGAPSVTQADKNRLLMRQQKEVSGRIRLSVAPAVALLPPKHETAGEQVFKSGMTVVPEQDANLNTFRGKIKPVTDSMLLDYAAAGGDDAWFSFADPRAYRCIVVMHLKGFRNGRRRRYWDNKTQSQITEFERVFGTGVADYRNGAKNPGT